MVVLQIEREIDVRVQLTNLGGGKVYLQEQL